MAYKPREYYLQALFRSSLPHPHHDRDYALYEVGEGCEVTYLIPGIDLLSERSVQLFTVSTHLTACCSIGVFQVPL